MRNLLFILPILCALIISGCAAFGTKTVYESKDLKTYNFRKLGYSQPAREKDLDKVVPGTSKLYEEAVQKFFSGKAVKAERYELPLFNNLEKPDLEAIRSICEANQLDGYLITQIRFLFVDNSVMAIPIGKSEDVFVEVKLYDKAGTLLAHTKHNTHAGNSYMMPPKAEMTVGDGTTGALRRVMKLIGRN